MSKKEEDKPASAGFAATQVTNLTSVSNNFSSPALKSTTSPQMLSIKSVQQQAADACANTDLYGCQPVLLRIYMDFAKQMMDAMKSMLGGISQNLGNLADGASGNFDSDGLKIYYSKTSSTVYSLLAKSLTNSGSYFYFSVNEGTYQMQIDFANKPSTLTDVATNSKIQVDLTYNSESSWDASILIVGRECEATDPRSPEVIKIKVAYDGSLWKGKAMLYNGRWIVGNQLGDTVANWEPTCSMTGTDERSANLFTDFVADLTSAKANVYMVKRDTTSSSGFVSTPENYALNAICTNYAANFGITTPQCNVLLAISVPSWPTVYTNPFCNVSNTLTATWGGACTGLSATVSAATFGASSLWTTPNALYQSTITLPTAL